MVNRINFCLIIVLLFSSCDAWVIPEDPKTEPLDIFDSLWKDVKERYSFFEHKDIDWENIRTTYRAKITSDMGSVNLFDVLASMLFELRDGHVNLSAGFDNSRNWEWYQDYPDNYDQNIIDKNYLRRDFWISGPLKHQFINDVLYVNYRSFSQKIAESNLQVVLERAKLGRGIIIDVRNNGGGSLGNAYTLASAFTDSEVPVARKRIKNGIGMDDFSTWEEITVPAGDNVYSGPVIVLTNRRSYSATTFFAQMMKELPQVTIVGDQTGGGGGIPVYGELINGWTYRFSGTQTIDMEGRQIEDGVLADVRVDLNPISTAKGEDNIITTALRILMGNN
ncbi:S41 family peptidase [uncultured Cyclobacterium sp.]|uniref:S41 family peptidase n=1 Tax=uncultured Cyclobacterium sp. TaxID=453820 RepID=UPI0030EE41AF|tara:strand:- start:52862 stop:53869 length:1008 start_codon:yes stop_codon:yes gene_type:complete